MTGAIFMASGRVPKILRIFNISLRSGGVQWLTELTQDHLWIKAGTDPHHELASPDSRLVAASFVPGSGGLIMLCQNTRAITRQNCHEVFVKYLLVSLSAEQIVF